MKAISWGKFREKWIASICLLNVQDLIIEIAAFDRSPSVFQVMDSYMYRSVIHHTSCNNHVMIYEYTYSVGLDID